MNAKTIRQALLLTGTALLSSLVLTTAAQAAAVRQSPIDINPASVTSAKAPLPIADHLASDVTLDVLNTYNASGKVEKEWATLKANVPAGSSIEVGGVRYSLLQFHFHTPSEHTVKGSHAPMEVHFVFLRDGAAPCDRSPDALLVIGARIESGAPSAELAKIFDGTTLPVNSASAHLTIPHVNLAKVLGQLSGTWRYSGSLTAPASFAPACVEPEGTIDEQLEAKDLPENVSWIVLSHPITMSAPQISAFKAIFPAGNSRETQPLNGRSVSAFN